jgi:hypothetical protein
LRGCFNEPKEKAFRKEGVKGIESAVIQGALTLSEMVGFSLILMLDEALLRRNTGNISSKSNDV